MAEPGCPGTVPHALREPGCPGTCPAPHANISSSLWACRFKAAYDIYAPRVRHAQGGAEHTGAPAQVGGSASVEQRVGAMSWHVVLSNV